LRAAAIGVIEIRPLRVSLGARVTGTDLAQLDNSAFNQIFRALLEHRLLHIEGQSVSVAKFREFARRFGALLPAMSPSAPAHPRHDDIAVLGTAVEPEQHVAQAMMLYALEIQDGAAESIFDGVPDSGATLPPLPGREFDATGRGSPPTGSAGAAYRHRWQAGDILVWDSQCVVHRAAGDAPVAGTFYRAAVAAKSH
jgi:alpha-ketoglutarate-dependent taurine dioxygenase